MDSKKTISCGQCGKPAIGEIGNVPVCLDCYSKFQHAQAAEQTARTLFLRENAAMINHILDEMDFISGIPSAGRIRLPPMPQSPITLNHMNNINFKNSGVIGSINTGAVKAIDVNISYLQQTGADNISDALKQFTEAVLAERSLTEEIRNELIEHVDFLSGQAVVEPKDRKPSTIKVTFEGLMTAVRAVPALATAWNAVEPTLKGWFGLGG